MYSYIVFASFFGNTNNYHTLREIAIPTGNIYQFIIICLPGPKVYQLLLFIAYQLVRRPTPAEMAFILLRRMVYYL
jgi:hypothetical protein